MGVIIEFAKQLSQIGSNPVAHMPFDVQPISGDVEVLEITIEGRQELPIFISVADEQILCICHLWKESEIKQEKRTEMLEFMLEMSIPMPLSSFAKIGDQYVIFGAMARHSRVEEVVHELEVLSDNSIEVIEIMKDFLK